MGTPNTLAALEQLMRGLRDIDLSTAAHVQSLEMLVMCMLLTHPARESAVMRFQQTAPVSLKAAREHADPDSRAFTAAFEAHLQRLILQATNTQAPAPGVN